MIRAATRGAMATAIRPGVEALGGVLYRWPYAIDPSPTRVTLILDNSAGAFEVPTYEANQNLRSSDTWRIQAVARAEAAMQDTATAEQLAEDLADAAIRGVHADSSLGGLTRSAGSAGTWRLQSVVATGDVEGPEVGDFEDGPAAFCVVTFLCTATIYR